MGLNIATAKFSINCEKIKRADGGYQGFGLSFAGRFGAKLASRPDVLVVSYFSFLRFRPKNEIPFALLSLPVQRYRAPFWHFSPLVCGILRLIWNHLSGL